MAEKTRQEPTAAALRRLWQGVREGLPFKDIWKTIGDEADAEVSNEQPYRSVFQLFRYLRDRLADDPILVLSEAEAVPDEAWARGIVPAQTVVTESHAAAYKLSQRLMLRALQVHLEMWARERGGINLSGVPVSQAKEPGDPHVRLLLKARDRLAQRLIPSDFTTLVEQGWLAVEGREAGDPLWRDEDLPRAWLVEHVPEVADRLAAADKLASALVGLVGDLLKTVAREVAEQCEHHGWALVPQLTAEAAPAVNPAVAKTALLYAEGLLRGYDLVWRWSRTPARDQWQLAPVTEGSRHYGGNPVAWGSRDFVDQVADALTPVIVRLPAKEAMQALPARLDEANAQIRQVREMLAAVDEQALTRRTCAVCARDSRTAGNGKGRTRRTG